MTRAERHEHLTRRHGFECACAELCDREEFEIEDTDRRVVEATATFGSALALARRLQTKNLPNRSGFNAKYLDLTSKLEDAVRAGKVRSFNMPHHKHMVQPQHDISYSKSHFTVTSVIHFSFSLITMFFRHTTISSVSTNIFRFYNELHGGRRGCDYFRTVTTTTISRHCVVCSQESVPDCRLIP